MDIDTLISNNLFRYMAASSWLNNQDWDDVMKHFISSKNSAEKLIARLRTSTNKIQTFGENIFE